MKALNTIIRVGALFALTLTISPAFTGDAHAYICKGNKYSGASTRRVKGMARIGARKSWENAMKDQFGLPWSVWSIAEDTSIECHMTGTKHTCLALGRPCQYVVQ